MIDARPTSFPMLTPGKHRKLVRDIPDVPAFWVTVSKAALKMAETQCDARWDWMWLSEHEAATVQELDSNCFM